tara:strand:+ start:877 stop:2277 length:1401 start_codon:yes stop_codon:yes gene_type:complete
MTNNNQLKKLSSIPNDESIDELDLKEFFQKILLKKSLIGSITVISVLFGGIYAYLKNDIYEGEIQIVLSTDTSSNADAFFEGINPSVQKILNKGPNINSLLTEVGVLKSPSVLMPIFNYVKQEKLKDNNKLKKWRYKSWLVDNLKIELEKGTSILNVIYRDNDKDMIYPVLNKISKAYQEYSGRDRLRSIENGINYLEGQIIKYKNKTLISNREAEEYASTYDLTTDSIELIRISASNTIRNIDSQIEQVKKYKDDENTIFSIAANMQAIEDLGLREKINNLNKRLFNRRLYYKEEDISIKQLLEEKERVMEEIPNQIIGALKADRVVALGRMDAATRPQEVIVKFKSLLRDVKRNQETLSKLESQLLLQSLQAAKYEDPWELITEPTINDFSVEPNKLLITLIFGFSGLLSGILIACLNIENNFKYLLASFLNKLSFFSKKLLGLKLIDKAYNKLNNFIKSILRE